MPKPDPLRYWCSECYADRGQRCEDAQGHKLAEFHQRRISLAEAMFHLYRRIPSEPATTDREPQ